MHVRRVAELLAVGLCVAALAGCGERRSETTATAPTETPAPAAEPAPTAAAEPLPFWAYYFPDEKQPAVTVDEDTPRKLEGSTKTFTLKQIDNLNGPPDWFPDQHPPAPPIVAKGKEPPVFACASCHLYSGMGHPESSSLAGLTTEYMVRQIQDMRTGKRRNPIIIDGKPQNNATQFMIAIAKNTTEAESRAAAEYFAKLKPIPWVKIVESATAPKSYITPMYMRTTLPEAGPEPLGDRIVELGIDEERQLLRDPRSGTVAYVPLGSVARGKRISEGMNGKILPCAGCHGPGLKGLGDAPHIAGRSPVYTFRQLASFKDGTRDGPMALLMKPGVAPLTHADMIAVSAYVASLEP